MEFTTKLHTYEIKTTTHNRVTDFKDGKPVYAASTQYTLFRNGEMLTFCFDVDAIEKMIKDFEWAEANPKAAAAMASRFD